MQLFGNGLPFWDVIMEVHDSFLSTQSVPLVRSPVMLSMQSSDFTRIGVVNCLDLCVTFNDSCVFRSTAAHSTAEAEGSLTSDLYCDDSLGGLSCPALAPFFAGASGPAGRLGAGLVPCRVLLPVDRSPGFAARTWINAGAATAVEEKTRTGAGTGIAAGMDFVYCVIRLATIEGFNIFGGRTISCQSRILRMGVGLFV